MKSIFTLSSFVAIVLLALSSSNTLYGQGKMAKSVMTNSLNGSAFMPDPMASTPGLPPAASGAPRGHASTEKNKISANVPGNYRTFNAPVKKTGAEVSTANKGYENHPEAGMLFAGAPCNNCYELIGRRTEYSKTFLQEGTSGSDGGKDIMTQTSSMPMHYKDAQGNWRTVKTMLQPDGQKKGTYSALEQEVPVTINTERGNSFSSLGKAGENIQFNHDLELIYVKADGREVNLGTANFAHHTAGDGGVYTTDVWPGIDMEMHVVRGAVKTNFYINHAMAEYADGKLEIRDHLRMDAGLSLFSNGKTTIADNLGIRNASGEEVYVISAANACEKHDVRNTMQLLNYSINGNVLDIILPGNFLNRAAESYPVIIDPLVSTATVTTPVKGSSYSPILDPMSGCPYYNAATTPANSTLTDIRYAFVYVTNSGGWLSDGAIDFYITGGCRSPIPPTGFGGLYWYCNFALPGTCTADGSAFYTLFSDFGSCIPAPQCAPHDLGITMYFYETFATKTQCGPKYINSGSDLTVTVYGRTVEFVSATPTPASICLGASSSLAGVGQYGVPPYTFSWTPGSLSGTPVVVTPTTTTTYNLTITDICGITAIGSTAVTVTPIGPISGTTNLCVGATATLTDVSGSGDTWVSTNPGVATISSPGGLVTAIASGTTTISLTSSVTGCIATKVVSVNLLPNAGTISGTPIVCAGAGTALTDAATGGVWSSTSPGTGTVSSSGVVSGISGGTTTISYTVTNSCGTASASQVVTVNPLPAAGTISGTAVLCVGATTSLTDAATSGAWSSTSPSVGTVSTTGVVTGLSAGTTTISYTLTNSCGTVAATQVVTVNSTPNAGSITGTPVVCAGANTALTDAAAGGVWSSTIPATGTVSTSGLVAGIAAGTTTISYTVTNSCGTAAATQVVTVNPLPNAGTISGTPVVCAGTNTALTDAAAGGAWSSTAPATGTVGATGIVTGIAAGTTTISYSVTNSCGTAASTQVVTVNPLPNAGAISGTPVVCTGANTSLTDATAGGAWSSVTPATGTVSSTGVVTGLAAGTTTISYTVTNSCGTAAATQVVTVNPLPNAGAISGTPIVCAGANTALTDAAAGGAWSSTAPATGTVGATGIVTGIAAGTTTISYSVTNSCGTAASTQVVTVNPLPNAGAISGTPVVCTGANTSLTDATAGGAWSSVTPATGTVSSTGVVTGLAAGTTTISYTVTNSCGTAAATQVVTVNPLPNAGAISGTPVVCAGANTALTDAAAGGAWSSTAPATGTVGATGIVAGIAAGTTTISYTATNSCGTASATQVVTVNPLPVAGTISGTTSVCPTATTSLTDIAAGGTWSSTASGIASIDATGFVTGVSFGTTTISYVVTNSCGTAAATTVVTVSASVDAGVITGTQVVCVSATTALSDAVSSGVWSSTATGVATVSASGVVSGVSSGTATISYFVTNTCGSAAATTVVTVNPLPVAGSISGTAVVCAGANTSLTDAAAGGAWSSTSTVTGTVSTSGVVTGIAAGTTTISYTVNNSCGTAAATQIVTVNPLPIAGSISGTAVVCAGASTSLTDAAAGGAWSSTNPATGTVSASGVVTGLAAGTTTISYTVNNSCGTAAAIQNVTVNPLPIAGSITGTAVVCAGANTSLTDAAAGGAWSSTNPATGPVNTSGVVTGIAAGTTTISYTVNNSCGTAAATQIVTVNPLPIAGSISGTAVVCAGANTSLTDAAAGGAWSSTNPATGTVSASGVVTGIAAGTTTISYTVNNSCGTVAATQDVTVNPLPIASSISGTAVVCAGASTSLTDAAAGGAWSSTNPATGTVSTSGVVTGIAAGTTTISYTVNNSCGTAVATQDVTVNPLPIAGSISGTAVVCAGANTSLTDAAAGGAWSSTNPAAGTVSTSGVVTGIAAGTTTISYTVNNSCGTAVATQDVTVNPLPIAGSISGTAVVCAGANTSLTDAAAGGAWSSTNPATGTVNTSGVVTGIAAGTTTISYTVNNSCGTVAATQVVTVNPLPIAGSISGTAVVCAGASTSLTDAAAGGAWSSTNPATGTVSASGVVTGLAAGTTTISYTVNNSCGTAAATQNVTVNPLPIAGIISGTAVVCAGANTSLTDAAAGGAWSSTNPATGTVSTSGVVTGIAAGTTTISYTVNNSCGTAVATQDVTVNPLPVAGSISGTAVICAGANTSLTDAAAGGVWSSTNPATGTVSTSGVVTGIAAGTTTISYTVNNSCGTAAATQNVTVNPLPVAGSISGTVVVCAGASTSLTDAAAGGAWSSTNPATGTVSTSGVVTGIAAGTTTISYTVNNSCGTAAATQNVTVNPLPIAGSITGTAVVCAGANTSLTDAAAGGAWSSTNPATGTISASGVVTGLSAGTTTISYTVNNSCGTVAATQDVTVNPLPIAGSITGTAVVCAGSNTSLTDAAAGGAWSSTNPATGTVSTSGVVTGIAAGTTTISYTVNNSCGTAVATQDVTVNPLPIAGSISGTAVVCAGASTSLTDAAAGGAWSSTNPATGTVSTSGVVTGIAAGTTTISYTVNNSCGTSVATQDVTVNPLPVAGSISGTAAVCAGASTSLTDAAAGGAWSSTNPATGTVSTSGVVTGIAAGATTISYTVNNSCGTVAATQDVTVNPLPVAGSISGTAVVCAGANTSLTDAAAGGAWSSTNPATGTVSTSGVVTGIAAGTTTISYTVNNSCGTVAATQVVTISSAPDAGIISGTPTVCTGATTALTDAAAGGAWSSTSPAIGTVSATGLVTGISNGTTTISYSVTNSCGTATATQVVTVNALPVPGTISGIAVACVGANTALTDAVTGGAWSSANPAVGTVSASGSVSCLSAGSTTISYTVTNGCGTLAATQVVTVNPLPDAGTITGPTSVCLGQTIQLTDASAGGAWTSDNLPVATVDGSGLVSGVGAGTAGITYSIISVFGCSNYTTVTITVTSSSAPISGTTIMCVGGSATLSDAAGGGTWASSNSNASIDPSGVVTGSAAGTSTITYAIGTGCTATTVVTITPTPTAAPTNDGPICAGGTVNLAAHGAGGTTVYNWSGAGLSSTAIANPTATPVATSVYSLMVTDGTGNSGCASNYTTTVGINTIGISASNDGPGCAGGTVHLTSTPSGSAIPASYSWSGPSGFSATNQNMTLSSLTTAMAGIYTVTVMANGSGCTATTTTNVIINTFSISAASNSPLCVGGNINLTATPTGVIPTGYSWSGPLSFSSTSQNPTLSSVGTNRAGTYSVTASAPGCTATASTIVVVNTIGITAANDAPACVGGSVNFTSTPSGTATPVSYSWSGPSGYTASNQNPTLSGIALGGAGAYTVTVDGGGSGCMATATTSVVVKTIGITASNDGPACAGGIIHLTSTPSGTATPANYNWSGPAGYSATIQNPTLSSVTTAMGGIYTAMVSAASGSGCTATTTINVVVNSFNVVATNNGPICVGGTLLLLATPSGTIAPVSYAWSGPTFVPSIQNPALEGETPSGSGIYTVTITATGSGCTATATTNVLIGTFAVSAASDGPVCTGGVMHLTSTASGTIAPTGYSWGGPAAYSSTISNPSISGITTAQGGVYTVTMTAPGSGCVAVNTTNVTVVGPPSSILGPSTVCVGSSPLFSDMATGGTWTSSNPSNASVGSATGIVTGLVPGTTVISYTLALGCTTSMLITVNPTPVVSGVTPICLNSSVTLTDDIPGGTWSSSNTIHATVDPATGVVSGAIFNGTSVIFYTLATGCQGSQTVTVNVIPSDIAGVHTACLGTSTILNDVYGGGVWSSTNMAVGTLDVTSGLFVTVTGIGVGTTTISYTISNGCAAIYNVTVNPIYPVTGTTPICVGTTIAVSDLATGGTWSSTHTGIATVGSSSGIITGTGAGTTSIVYTTTAGCTASTVVTVMPTPLFITGPATVCVGSSSTLSEPSTGGTWSASNGNVTLGGSGNIVTGATAGTVIVSYSFSDGCSARKTVTVNDIPSTPMGTLSFCAGSTSALTDASSGGLWSSGNTSVATVGPSSGIVNGVAGGTATISYSTGITGCAATVVITVNAILPITGNAPICVGGTCNLNDASGGGTWSTADAIITVGSSGIVTGLSVGSATVTYTIPAGCTRTATITINPAPSPISGTLVVCAGATTTLTDDGSGTWSSGSTTIATVGASSGVVTGGSAGTATITYATGIGCFVTAQVTVNPAPSGIGGASGVCTGLTISLSDFTSGGAWSTVSTNISLDGSGNVTGLTIGTATITYATGASCYVTRTINVNPLPGPISGNTSVCLGAVTFLSDPTAGGISWTSSNTSVATISPSGSVSALSYGATTITYMLGTGCIATTTVTVIAMPPPVTGSTPVCPGATLALTDASGAGTWTSNNTAIATVNPGTGIVTGVSSGMATITYLAAGAGCVATTVVTISPLTAIFGTMTMCQGAGVILHNTTSGGTWSTTSGNITIGSATGAVTGISAGTAFVTYTLGSGCLTTAVVTVNGFAAAITGSVPMCEGSSITLGETTPGGTWSSGSVNAAVDGSGNVTAVAAGTATISYAVSTGCNVSVVVTVNQMPSPVSGNLTLCAGTTTSLSDVPAGGTWSSGSGAANVGSTGLVTGLAQGTATISYVTTAGCGTYVVVSVNGSPSVISGSTAACVGSSINLTVTTGGGMWVSSSPVTGSVGSASGTVTALAAGVVTISYVLGTGCYSTAAVTINNVPANITGALSVCSGNSTSLTDVTPGGTWTSDNTTVATVGSTGTVFAAGAAGTANIIYGFSGVGCTTSRAVTVNPLPATITGTAGACVGATTPLTDITTGGAWTSSNTFVATIGASTGIVSGVAAGTARITYTAGGCITTAVVTINAVPGSIGGATSVCNGSSITLSDLTAGGAWTSTAGVSLGAGSAATVTVVTGTAVGTSTVTYAVSAGCYKTYAVTVKAIPTPILGTLSVCEAGSVTFLSDLTTGVSWTIAPVTVATVSASGRVYGATAGTATVTFTGSNACVVTAVVTVNALPVVAAITGPSSVAHLATITLSDATTGGLWSSTAPAIGSVGSTTGIVKGVASAGTTTISYTVTSAFGCKAAATKVVTVTATAPHPVSTTVSGTTELLIGNSVSIAFDGTSGIWISENTGVATVDENGTVTALAPGTSDITHVVTNSSGEVSTNVTPVTVTSLPMDVRLVPNPNNGNFTVTGTTGSIKDEDVTLEITDVLGQVIYKSKITANSGRVNEPVSLGSSLANGMYVLDVRSNRDHKVYHFVIAK